MAGPRYAAVVHISGALAARGVHLDLFPHLTKCDECVVCEEGTDTLILLDAVAAGAMELNNGALRLADLRTETIEAAERVIGEMHARGAVLTDKQADLAERLAAYHAAGSDRPAP